MQPPQVQAQAHHQGNRAQGVYAIPYGVPPPVEGAQFRSDLVAIVPPPPSRAQFDEIVKHRYVAFSSSMYFRQAWHFVKQNACNLISALFCCVLLLGLLEVLNAHIVSFIFPKPPTVHSHKSSPTTTPDDDSSMFYIREDGTLNTDAMTVPTHMDLYVERTITRMILVFAQSILILTPIQVSAITAIFDAFRHNHTVMIGDLLGGKMTRTIYWRLLPLASILTIGSTLLWVFVIPGLLFSWYTFFCLPLFVDHGHYLSAWEHIKTSAKLVYRYTCSLFLFWIQMIAIQLLGLMACGFGVFVTSCIAFMAWIYCYHHLFPINGVAIWVPRWSPSVAHMAEAGHPLAENPDGHGQQGQQQGAPAMAVAVPYAAAQQPVWAQPVPYNIQDAQQQEHRPLVQAYDVPPHPAMDSL